MLLFSLSVLMSLLEWESTFVCALSHILFRNTVSGQGLGKIHPSGRICILRQGSHCPETPTLGRASVPGTDSPPGRKVAAGPQPQGHEQAALIENRSSEAATNFLHSTGQENDFCRFCVSQTVCVPVRDLVSQL